MPRNVFLAFTPARHYLREWRDARGMSQEELGKKCGTTGATISRYEKGDRGLPLELQLKLFEVLEILPGQFFAPPETPSLDARVSAFATAHELAHLIFTIDKAAALAPEERAKLILKIRELAELSPQSPQSTRREPV